MKIIPTLWHNDGIAQAWAEGAPILRQARVTAVQLHTWTPNAVADTIRQSAPGIDIVCGFGVDSIARDLISTKDYHAAVATFKTLAGRAHAVGAKAVVWNAEASWKLKSTSEHKLRVNDVIREGLLTVASTYPELEQWHTAYDHPSFHATYPWQAWLGAGSPIVRALPQVYAAPGKAGVMAVRGSLPRRKARALASWASAARAGWIAQDDPSTPQQEGVVWSPYFQAHSVPAVDTVAQAIDHEVTCLWAAPTRMDPEGRKALNAMCALDRLGFWRAGGIADFQRSAGLAPDGVFGPLTLAAALKA